MTRPPKGLEMLVEIRRARKLPNDRNVSLNVGDGWKDPDWIKLLALGAYPVGVVRSTDRVKDLDLRCLSGLHVFIHCQIFTPQVAELYEAAQKFAQYIALVVLDWADPLSEEWRANNRRSA